jgi:RNA polymerase sigma-70 factor (ECF subfamily)
MTAIEFNYAIYNTSRSLKSFAVRLTKDWDDANDLLQDTLVKAFLNREKYTDGTNLKAWLYTIMKNTFITNYQKMVRRNTYIDVSDNLHYINNSSSAVENEAYQGFAMEDIQKALDAVEDIYSKPFMMYFNGYKYHEISEKLDLPIGTVKNRIHMARKELKERLIVYGTT